MDNYMWHCEDSVTIECTDIPFDESIVTEKNNDDIKNLRDFIELYEILPELWNPTNPAYVKKDKRNIALDKLVPVFRKIKSGANRGDVRRKINTLRSNYRKELKKIIDSKRSGKGSDEIYQPSSWVFYSLQFLDKYEKPVNSENQQMNETCLSDDLEHQPVSATQTSSRSSIMSPPPPQRNKRRTSINTMQNELLQKA